MTAGAVPRPAVLIPAYNAARHLGSVLEGVLAHVPRQDVWVVDDGSGDETANVAERREVHVVRQTPNQGKGAALRAGFAAALDRDPVITLDADGQHDPADLPRFLAVADTADLVVGARPFSDRMPPLRKIGNRISARIIGALAGQAIPDSQSGYRLHRRALIESVVPAIEGTGGFLFETELLVRAARQGYRIGALPIATVYGDAGSHFHPASEIPRFLQLFVRLAWLVASGRAGRRPPPPSS